MKAHALSLSLLLAVLPALSHPPAVPAADARQPQESWQLPWAEGGSGPVHSYRGPVREEFLQCERGQCPLPVHDGTAPACGTGGALPPAVAPAASLRQDEPVARGRAGEKKGPPAAKGQEAHAEQGIPSREKTPSATAATGSPAAAGKGMAARTKGDPSTQTSSGDPSEKRQSATSVTTSRQAAGTVSGAAPAPKPAAARDAAPVSGTDSPSGTAAGDTSAPVIDEKAAYQAGLELILSGRLDEGMARMQALLEQYPSGSYAANAEYWLGEALSSQGRNEEALAHFRNVEARYPRHHKNADALLRTGMILKRQGDAAGAGKAFRQVVQRFPSSAAADLIRKKGLVQP